MRANIFSKLSPKLLPALLSALLLAIAITASFANANFAKAQNSNKTTFNYGSVKLVLTNQKKGALFFNLQKGWKLYWRKNNITPLPTNIKWKNNLSKIIWPVPNSFTLLGMKSYGYQGEVVLPFKNREQEKVGNSAQVNFLVCREVCLPIKKNLVANPATESEKTKIITALALVPRTYSDNDSSIKVEYLPVATKALQKSSKKTRPEVILVGNITLPENQKIKQPRIIIEENTENGALFDVESIKNRDSRISFKAVGNFENSTQKYNLRVTIFDEKHPKSNQPIEWTTLAKLAPYKNNILQNNNTPNILRTKPILWLIIISILGGLILNAMPCVFPVLAIKIASLARIANPDNLKHTRQALIANALGMICAFLILAACIIVVSTSGRKLGWGFQFQWPFFNGALVAILAILAADGLRIITIPFPPYRAKNKTNIKELRADFLTGILITWIATPCAAPIFGSALSAALVQKPTVVIIMFTAMGAGMAAPFLLAAAVPKQTARLLPKPGAWSEILRKILGAIILIVAIWLLTIFAKQVSASAAILLVASLVGVISIVRSKLIDRLQQNYKLAYDKVVFAILFVVPLILVLLFTQTLSPIKTQNAELENKYKQYNWSVFEPKKIPMLLEKNNIVLVDVTADWCLSCKVNEQLVYQSPRVIEKMQSMRLVQMRADWTSQNQTIEEFLRQHNRYAIPFTVIFAPEKETILLPELFSANTFLNALAYAEKLQAIKTQNNQN